MLQDRLQEKLSEIAVTLVAIQKDLGYHIRRTDLNETEIKAVTSRLELIEKDTQRQLTELTISVESSKKSVKLVVGLLTIINIIIAISGSIK